VRADGTLEPAQVNKFVEQARRQLSAANGKPVEWNFSNKAVAEAAEEAFDEARSRWSSSTRRGRSERQECGS
jgi:hypothetical protein